MECKICQSKKYKVIRGTLRYNIKRNVMQCSKCGFVFLEPKKKETKNYYSGKDYRKRHGPILGKDSSPREIFNIQLPFQKLIINEIKHILKPSFKVLDVGCSTGYFLHALKGKVKTRVGLELNQVHVSFIRKNLDFKVYSEPIEDAKIKEGPFDMITCMQVLEHVDDPFSFLQAIYGNLKKGGYLYLETPNINEALMSSYEIDNFKDFYFREPHVSYFSVDTLKLLLMKVGFRGKTKTTQGYNILNHLNWILTGKPQASFSVGTGVPALVKSNNADKRVKKEINDFIKMVDIKYKKILAKHDAGENLSFLGRKKLN